MILPKNKLLKTAEDPVIRKSSIGPQSRMDENPKVKGTRREYRDVYSSMAYQSKNNSLNISVKRSIGRNNDDYLEVEITDPTSKKGNNLLIL